MLYVLSRTSQVPFKEFVTGWSHENGLALERATEERLKHRQPAILIIREKGHLSIRVDWKSPVEILKAIPVLSWKGELSVEALQLGRTG